MTGIGVIMCSVFGAALAAPTTQPAGEPYHPPASKYPLHYPVSDRTRSVMRTAREQIGLTAQDMQALGLSYEEVRAVLKTIRDWAEPRRARLEKVRDSFIAARAVFLSTEGKIFSLEQRLARLDQLAGADAGLRDRLEEELARHRAELPAQRAHFEKVDGAYEARFRPLIEQVNGVLSLPQREQWAASRRNKSHGLPVTLQFIPDVTAQQLERIREGEEWPAVFSQEQQASNAAAMRNYAAHKEVVYRAEMKFFFGRDIPPRDTEQAGVVAHHSAGTGNHPPAAGAGASASRCPFSRLFGRSDEGRTTARPGDQSSD